MSERCVNNTLTAKFRRLRSLRRRGVVSVVSMMFLIIFGSLAAAMAIMSRGNLVTAATHQHVIRAMGAAETGMAVAEQRLREAAFRFVVERGTVDSGFGSRLWTGSFNSGDGQVTVLPPLSYNSAGSPAGLAEAVAEIHAQDQNKIDPNADPTIVSIPSGMNPSIYAASHWVQTPAVGLTPSSENQPAATAFQITYAPLADGRSIRVIVTGYDYEYKTRNSPVTRRITQDFNLVKRVNAAVLSPSRIMIGKNVMVEGDLGAVFDDVDQEHGDPLVIKSDFWGIDDILDAALTDLFNALATYDVDKDNRLRVGHPIEGPGIPPGQQDVTGDGYVDEFDLFIMKYDDNNDGVVVLSSALTAGTPASGMSAEFTADDDLALLIDSSRPDRNKNRIFSFTDTNGNGRFDPGIDMLTDIEQVTPGTVPTAMQPYIFQSGGNSYIARDQVLGFRDGVIDRRDQYAKVAGKLVFRVSESQWIAGRGNYMERLRGPINPTKAGDSAMRFDTPYSELPELGAGNFTNSQTALRSAANGQTFEQQVAANLGISTAQLATWTAANNSGSASAPKYYPLSPDTDNDTLPDNWQTAHFERMPFNSPTYTDWYYRPVYENMTFKNVQIPQGNNGLFKNCQFIGVTFVRSSPGNNHINWTIYGKLKLDAGSGRPQPDPTRYVYGGTSFPAMLSNEDRPVIMATTPLDKADIAANQVQYTMGYNSLPDPLIINGFRVIDTKKLSNNIRFHDSLFVGSIVSDTPGNYTHARNKLQFTGATRFTQQHPEYPEDPTKNPDPEAVPEIAKSSLMLPNYSVDIGSFNSPPTQDVRLRGAVVAGVLDVRGNADIDGALLLTFRPVLGEIPLIDALGNPVGNPSLFNATLGYFGPEDGDDESLDPSTLPILNGTPIVGYDTDGDGLPDVGPFETQPAGSTPVPFHGYGRVSLRFDPNMALPDGIMLPLQVDIVRASYKETSK